MSPLPVHTRRGFLSGLTSGFAGISLSEMLLPIDIRETFRRGLPALALVSIALALPTAMAAPAEEQDFPARQAETKKVFTDRVTPFFKTYCTDCHGIYRMESGINFAPALQAPGAPSSAKMWKQALANVKAHNMPPAHAKKQPTEEERQLFADWVGTIKYLTPQDPGVFVIRRLTKVEYGNTLRDLFGVDPAVAAELPDEVSGAGYLNTLSPLQSEKYLAIANEVLNRVLAPKNAPPTKVQKRLFGEKPAPGSDLRAAAKKVARSLTRSAYRRPASEAELETLLGVFDLGMRNKLSYPAALRLMLKAVLVSPQFLFITPAGEPQPGQTIAPLDDYQLASRLSYFLWATMPDAELSALADAGKLHEPAVLRAQVKRLLADARSRALFDGFGVQWLGLGELGAKTFDPAKFPQMTPELRAAMVDEARLFFDSIVRENRSVVDFVDSDTTFVNGALAPLYGLEKTITGPQMRRVKLKDANRGGVLAMPGVLAATSFPNRTSAVKRGVWVLEQVLGEHVPPPPPNVPPLDKQDRKTVENLTLRQRTELHRTNAVCANCHKTLDPIGFGLENFDAIGRWREKDDTGGTIDAAGELPGGKRFSSPRELKAIIAARKEQVARNLTRKLLAYALCRQLEGYDEVVVDQVMETLAKDDYRMQTLITEIATSYPFVNRRIQEPEVSSNAK
jgi:mono/diheme cytochrome c family protein